MPFLVLNYIQVVGLYYWKMTFWCWILVIIGRYAIMFRFGTRFSIRRTCPTYSTMITGGYEYYADSKKKKHNSPERTRTSPTKVSGNGPRRSPITAGEKAEVPIALLSQFESQQQQ